MKFRSASRHGLWLATTGGGGSWSPTEIGPAFWLDAQAEAERRALTTAQTAQLASFNDDASGWHPTQATPAAQPVLQHDGARWFANFDGVDDKMVLPATAHGMLRNLSGATILAVYAQTAFKTTNMIFRATAGNGSAYRMALNYDGNLNTADDDDFVRPMGKRLDADAIEQIVTYEPAGPTTRFHNNVFSVIGAVFDYSAATLRAYRNTTLHGVNLAFQTSGNTSDTDSTLMQIGHDSGSFGWVLGKLAALMIVPRAISTGELAQVVDYYNVRSSLGL